MEWKHVFKTVSFLSAIGLVVIAVIYSHERHKFELDQSTSAQEATVSEQSLASNILKSAKKAFVSGGSKLKQKKSRKSTKSPTTEIDGFTLDARASAVLNEKSGKSKHHILDLHFSNKKTAPKSSLLKRMPGYVASKKITTEARKQSARQKLEAKIAAHQLTTRGLVKAVKAAEERHFKELNEDLKDQTDDLIIAKVSGSLSPSCVLSVMKGFRVSDQ